MEDREWTQKIGKRENIFPIKNSLQLGCKKFCICTLGKNRFFMHWGCRIAIGGFDNPQC